MTPNRLRTAAADGVTVVDDESALQAAVDQMMKDAKNEMVASFQNQAFSEDVYLLYRQFGV